MLWSALYTVTHDGMSQEQTPIYIYIERERTNTQISYKELPSTLHITELHYNKKEGNMRGTYKHDSPRLPEH